MITNRINSSNFNKRNSNVLSKNKELDLILKEFHQIYKETKEPQDKDAVYYHFFKTSKIYYQANDFYLKQSLEKRKDIKKNIVDAEVCLINLFEKYIKNIAENALKDTESGVNKKMNLIRLSHIMSLVQDLSRSTIDSNARRYFETQRKYFALKINKDIFKNNVSDINAFGKFLKKEDKKDAPILISLFLSTNIDVDDSYKDVHLSPKTTFNKKRGDCSEYTFLADYLLKSLGFETLPIGFSYNKREVGHAVCLFKDVWGKWDLIDTNGYWNKNWDNPIEKLKEMFKDIKTIFMYDVKYNTNGGFVSNIRELNF